MIVRIVDKNDNIISIPAIVTIREIDDMIVMTPANVTTAIHINGCDTLRSAQVSIDSRTIKSMGVLA